MTHDHLPKVGCDLRAVDNCRGIKFVALFLCTLGFSLNFIWLSANAHLAGCSVMAVSLTVYNSRLVLVSNQMIPTRRRTHFADVVMYLSRRCFGVLCWSYICRLIGPFVGLGVPCRAN